MFRSPTAPSPGPVTLDPTSPRNMHPPTSPFPRFRKNPKSPTSPQDNVDIPEKTAQSIFCYLPPHIKSLDRVHEIDLEGRNLDNLPDDIWNCIQLEKLNIRGNNIETLSSEIGKFQNLRELDLSGNKLSQLPKEFGSCRQLQSLCISENRLTYVPPEIGKLYHLKQLKLDKNQISELCPEIENCSLLEKVDLTSNKLKELVPEVGKLCNLKELTIDQNSLQELPSELAKCTLLEKISVSSNHLQRFPPELGNLKNVVELDMKYNQLSKLPSEIGHCLKLEKLNVGNNHLTHVPSEIGKLTELKELYVGGNDIPKLPSAIGRCTNLKVLNLGSTQLETLTTDIGKLKQLKELDLSGNLLSKLPPDIGNCENLEELNVWSNQLKKLPTEIGNLLNLKVLNAQNNKLPKVPSEICYCTQLEKINLTSNELTNLPAGIGTLKNLKRLYLDGNKVVKLPTQIGMLSNLREFLAQNNKLTTIPVEFFNCTQLEKINLANNELENIPEVIGILRQLSRLSLDSNRLCSLPRDLFSCTRLEKLTVRANKIQGISAEIGALHQLKELDIRNNKIGSLPIELASCRKLQKLKVDGNELTMPAEILSRDTVEILEYLRELKRHQQFDDKHRNVMVVGNSLVGKTSFVECLLKEGPCVTTIENRTELLERHKWKVDSKQDPPIQLEISLCDFGSEDHCGPVMKTFCTQKTVYPIVFNIREYSKSTHQKQVYRWIESLNTIVPGVHIQFIGTHRDMCSTERVKECLKSIIKMAHEEEKMAVMEINQKLSTVSKRLSKTKQQSKASTILKEKGELERLLKTRPVLPDAAYAVSCKTYEGIKEARDAIIEALGDARLVSRQKIPSTWLDLHELINQVQLENDCCWIYMEQVKALGRQVFLDDEESLFPALRYLENRMEIIWKKRNAYLKNVVFHKPTEILRILKPIMSQDIAKQLSNRNVKFLHFTEPKMRMVKKSLITRGLLERDMLACFYKDMAPDEESLEVLKELLINCGLAYTVPSNVHRVSYADEIRLPGFLPRERPMIPWEDQVPQDVEQVTIKSVFRKWSPPGLFECLCAQLQRHLSFSLDWKTGLYAKLDESELLFLLIPGVDHEHIELSIRGKEILNIWKVLLPIKRDMDLVLSQWPGVICDRFVICPSCVRKHMAEPCTFTDEWLEEAFPHTSLCCQNPQNMEMMRAERVYPPAEVLHTFGAHYRNEQINYLRYSTLVLCYGTECVRQILQQHIEPMSLAEWADENEQGIFIKTRGPMKWVYRKLFPPADLADLQDLDISALMCIFRKILDDFDPPSLGWNREPQADDMSVAADILRLGNLRNEPYLAHSSSCEMGDVEFEAKWADAEAVIKRLGGHSSMIMKLKLALMPNRINRVNTV